MKVPLERRATQRLVVVGFANDLPRTQGLTGVAAMILGHRRAGKKSFKTSRPSAIAWRPRDLLRCRPGQRVVPPFSCNRIGADQDLTPDRDAAPDPRPENDA